MSELLKALLVFMGIVGLSELLTALRFGRHTLSRMHGFLRLHRTEPVDIVISESERTPGGVGIRYMRATTAVGDLTAAAELSQVVGRAGRNRPITVTVSRELKSQPAHDLLLLGMPGKNSVARLLVEHIARCHPEISLEIRQGPTDCCIALDGYCETYTPESQSDVDIPTRDLALIVMWVNPFATRKRRLMYCAGFTAYGTAIAANYLVNALMNDRYAALKREYRRLPSLYRLRSWPCFAMVIEVRLINDQLVDVSERAFAALDDPGRPPLPDGAKTTH